MHSFLLFGDAVFDVTLQLLNALLVSGESDCFLWFVSLDDYVRGSLLEFGQFQSIGLFLHAVERFSKLILRHFILFSLGSGSSYFGFGSGVSLSSSSSGLNGFFVSDGSFSGAAFALACFIAALAALA